MFRDPTFYSVLLFHSSYENSRYSISLNTSTLLSCQLYRDSDRMLCDVSMFLSLRITDELVVGWNAKEQNMNRQGSALANSTSYVHRELCVVRLRSFVDADEVRGNSFYLPLSSRILLV